MTNKAPTLFEELPVPKRTWEVLAVPEKRQFNTKTPRLSVRKTGIITWNQALHEALRNPEWVKVVYSKAEGLIGITSTNDSNAKGLFVKHEPHTDGRPARYAVNAGTTLKLKELCPKKAFRGVASIEAGVAFIEIDFSRF
jgi:hypothetical protein